MTDEFLIRDPEDARDFLRDLPRESKRKGESIFREGRVQDLRVRIKGSAYECRVADDGQDARVTMAHNPGDGWDAECSCEEVFDCEHIFAAMSALLAEHRVLEVQNLSAGGLLVSQPGRSVIRREPEKKQLARRLSTALGRKLTRTENDFLNLLETVYARSSYQHGITGLDFARLGMPIPKALGWAPLPVWPTLPESDYEFWLHLALYARDHGVSVPDFMQPVTDVTLVEPRVREWQRSLEVARWREVLAAHQLQGIPSAKSEAVTDLRVLIDRRRAHLQLLQPGQQRFEMVKPMACRRMLDHVNSGRLRFTPEGQLIWQLFRQQDLRPTLDLESLDDDEAADFSSLLRLPLLQSRVVDPSGQPLLRPAEPLKWELSPPSGLSGDYVLELKQANNAKAPPILCVLPGTPVLYLTPHAVYHGPKATGFLDPATENRIPALALESESGIGLLEGLEVKLPPSLSERVKRLPYHVRVKARLQPPSGGVAYEQCVLEIHASSAEGAASTWTGYQWSNQLSGRTPRHPSPGGQILVRDTAILRQMPSLLEPLNLKVTAFGHPPSARVTRQFPAVFTSWLKSLPPQVTVELEGELASLTSAEISGQVKLEVSEAEIDWFDLRVVLQVSDTELTPEEIKLLLNARGQFVRLKGKGWRRLKYDLTEEDDERLARLGLNPRELTAEPQRLHALQLADNAAGKFLPAEQVEQVQRRAGEIKTRVAPPLPSGVTAQMRPYQLEGFHFLAYLSTNRFGGILADDMGLGKTLQTLAWLVWLREQVAAGNRPGPSLVVCPKSVMDNWHAEAERFTPGLRVRSWSPSEKSDFLAELNSADLHVLNYSQLRMLGESLAPVKWLAVILDEGQYIKNPASQTALVARSLQAGHRLVLSGTPIENRLLDLWSLMSFAMPGILGSRTQFAKLFDAKGDPFARQRLAARVRPFLLRRTKAQVARDLPDRVEEDLFCEIEGEQQALYRAELKRAQQMLLGVRTREQLAREQFHFLASLLRLRQICCHPRLVHPGCKETGAKTEALLEQLEPLMEEGHKVLVFSQFVELLDLVKPLIEERLWPCFYLAGHTENRGQLVKEFQITEGAAVFLISLKAGGFGLNLTAASYVVLFDPWWNPAVENQAIDRTHRIGQVNKVMAYRLLIKNSIEEKIRHLQRQKKAMAEDVLGEERFTQSLSLEDFAFLFAD